MEERNKKRNKRDPSRRIKLAFTHPRGIDLATAPLCHNEYVQEEKSKTGGGLEDRTCIHATMRHQLSLAHCTTVLYCVGRMSYMQIMGAAQNCKFCHSS